MIVKTGEHKGLKGRVYWADDNIVKLVLLATDTKLILPKDQVQEVKDPTKPLAFRAADLSAMSFESAAK